MGGAIFFNCSCYFILAGRPVVGVRFLVCGDGRTG